MPCHAPRTARQADLGHRIRWWREGLRSTQATDGHIESAAILPSRSRRRHGAPRLAATALRGDAARSAGCRRCGSSRPRCRRRAGRRPRRSCLRVWPCATTVTVERGCRSSSSPMRSNDSVPVRPSEAAVCRSRNCSGSTPMPTRFERWMRSNDSASTARTPSRRVPLAAQSRDEPEPYSAPARIISGVPSAA